MRGSVRSSKTACVACQYNAQNPANPQLRTDRADEAADFLKWRAAAVFARIDFKLVGLAMRY